MSNDELTPAPIVGGGINTGSFEQPIVVTQMLGIGQAEPIREETLRARFLSFEPLFDSASRLAAYELVIWLADRKEPPVWDGIRSSDKDRA